MDNKATLGERAAWLRRARARADGRRITQQEVADAVGIDRGFLACIERDHYCPGREVLVALADYYRTSVGWLATGQGEIRVSDLAPCSDDEKRLLAAYRAIPAAEARPLLEMLESRMRSTGI